MADGVVGVFDESGAGTKKVDTTELTVGGVPVERERVVLTGEAPDEIARVDDVAPASNAMGLVVRPIVTAGMEADGHSATLGTTTDAAVTSSVTGTVSAKLRGLIEILADVWDSVAHKLKVDTGLTPLTDTQLRASPIPVSGTVTVLDGSGPLTVDGTVTVTDGAGSLTVDGTVALGAGETHVGAVGLHVVTPTASFTRPADTSSYAAGDLVANSTTAGAVVPLSWAVMRVAAGACVVNRVRIRRSGTSNGVVIRVHLFAAQPTVTNGDNGALIPSNSADYLGYFDVSLPYSSVGVVFTDGQASSSDRTPIAIKLGAGSTIYGLLEAAIAMSPDNAETIAVTLEVTQE